MKPSPRLQSALALAAAALTLLTPKAGAQGEKPSATKSGFVTSADGARIHYIDAGKGPAILFVPGWTMPGWIWEKQITQFAMTHRVVAMDPRAQGESSQTAEGLYPAARARDIKAVTEQLKLAPVVLVGWSMGAIELAAYVDQYGTDTLAGLVFVDGWAGRDFDPNTLPTMFQWVPGFQKGRRQWTEDFLHSSYMFKKPQPEGYLERLREAMLKTPTNSAMAIWLGYITSDFRPALARIDKPTLIIAAEGGLCGSACEDMHKRIRGSQLQVIENVGHALFVEEPERFNSLLEDFVSGLAH
ncbi:MAG TPA: alpha/beta hydrolase [Candidatus Acidoferrum sp.]|nr:alpha/beta hydrolase [Candidatus Acidoferrum sp.]